MKKFYLIGNSIEKSFSPYIHTWIYQFFNINAQYKNKKIEIIHFDRQMPDILTKIKAGSIDGINITNPYKIKIISSHIILSKNAKNINAVNCIYKYNNHLLGDNTDWIGFVQSINKAGINLHNYNVKIIGAGGAARAIIYSLQKLGIKKFQIYNRTKTTFIVNQVEYTTQDLDQFINSSSKNIFLINCIKTEQLNHISTDKTINSINFLYDLNYHKSLFHNILEGKDIKVILGLDMLIYQAIKSIEIWLKCELMNKIDIEEIKVYLKKKSLC